MIFSILSNICHYHSQNHKDSFLPSNLTPLILYYPFLFEMFQITLKYELISSLTMSYNGTFRDIYPLTIGFPGGTNVKEPASQCQRLKRCRLDPWVGKIPWRRKWQPTPVFLPGESRGQGSLVGCRLGSHRVRHDWNDLAAAATILNPTYPLIHIYLVG